MPFRYFLKQILMPPGLLLILLCLAFFLRRRFPRLAVAGFVIGLGGFWLMSLPVAVGWGARLLEQGPPLARSEWAGLAERADAIVILGAGRERGDPAWGADQPGVMARERLRYAARLAKASGLPILTSGGLHYGSPPSEAQIMAESLRDDYGVAVRWQEGHSRTTWENAQDSAAILRQAGIRRVVLVTQALHMRRAQWSFRQVGLEVIPAPHGFIGVDNARPFGGWLPEGKAVWQSELLFNEAIGLLGYRMFYR
ncbi:hypothetical protein D3C78_951630 [compost metagenome]